MNLWGFVIQVRKLARNLKYFLPPCDGLPWWGPWDEGLPPEDGPWDEGLDGLPLEVGPWCLSTTVLLVLSVSVTVVFDFSTNSLLEVDELKTGGFSEDPALTGVWWWTQLHELCWNLSWLLHLAAILLLILLPQNDPVDEGPDDGPEGLPLDDGPWWGPWDPPWGPCDGAWESNDDRKHLNISKMKLSHKIKFVRI